MLIREITSLQHPIVKHLVKLRENRKYRQQTGSVLISGIKVISELSSLFPLKTLLIGSINSTDPLPRGFLHSIRVEQTFEVTHAILKKVTSLQEPEPVAAEISLPLPSDLRGKKTLLVLDSITDPGNLGTLFRTALALNWEGIFLTPLSVDPFNEKALRAAQGATFKLPYREGSYDELYELLQENKMSLLVADLMGEKIEYNRNQMWKEIPCALALGNESHGVNPVLKNKGRSVSIPINSQVESLNVAAAGAILMHAFRKDLHG